MKTKMIGLIAVAAVALSTAVPRAQGPLWIPTQSASWQWQLTGSIDQSVNAPVYDIDLFDASAATVSSLRAKGRRVICYMSAGSWENWRPDASRFPSAVKGKSNGWPGEKWLDIRRIDLLAPIMRARLDLCVSKGFDAVEPDNIDGYSNTTGFPLKASDQIAYNKWLAAEAHARGLAVALKNDAEQARTLQPFFDFAIVEECVAYRECGDYSSFITAGKAVLAVEYSGSFPAACSKFPAGFSGMKKREDLDAWRQSCL